MLMLLVVSLLSSLVAAVGAYLVLLDDADRKAALIERDDLEAIRASVDPGAGALLCAFFPIVTPLVLARARGVGGFFEGAAIALAAGGVSAIAAMAWTLLR